ncbi:unnamed protein product [Caenorhabditis nigoni]
MDPQIKQITVANTKRYLQHLQSLPLFLIIPVEFLLSLSLLFVPTVPTYTSTSLATKIFKKPRKGVEYHGFGRKTVGIRTRKKATACETLVALAKEMEEDFLLHVLDVYELATKDLGSGFDCGVQADSAEIVSFLLVCVKKQHIEDELCRLRCEFLKTLTTATNEEDDDFVGERHRILH